MKSSSGSLVSFFVRHPNAANLLMVLMLIAGIWSLTNINTQFFPTIETKVINVTVVWSGASAEDVESNILPIVEPEVRFLDGMKEMISFAREGSALIRLEFSPQTDMEQALGDTEEAMNGISTLPENSEEPKVSYRSFRDSVSRIAISGPFTEPALKVFARKIRDELIERGIDKVSFTGMRDEEIEVVLNNYDLRRLGLTISDVSSKIASGTRDLPSGNLDGDVEKQVRTLSARETPASIGNIDILSGVDGNSVRLRDFASVRQVMDKGQVRGVNGGLSAIEIHVQRSPGQDALEAARIVENYLEDTKGTFPKSLTVVRYEGRTKALIGRIQLLVKNASAGLLLVVLVLALFLNVRIAFWVAAGIPVAVLAAFTVIWMVGGSINMISLFAFLMMLGIIVDDAIVVGEETATRYAAGEPGPVAAEKGGMRMAMPVFAASVTTIAAFSPIFLIGEVVGQIMSVLPVVVIAVLIASLIECFLILPGHLAHALAPRPARGWSFARFVIIAVSIMMVLQLVLFFASLTAQAGSIAQYAELPDPDNSILRSMVIALASTFNSLTSLTNTVLVGLGNWKLTAGQAALMFLTGGLALLIALGIEWLLHRGAKKRAMHTGHQKRGAVRKAIDNGFDWFREKPFNYIVTLAYDYRYATAALCITSMVMASSLLAGGLVKFQFFPSAEPETISARLVFNAGIKQHQSIAIIDRLEEALFAVEKELGKGEKLIVARFTTLGQSGFSQASNVASMRVRLTTSEERSVRTKNIVQAWQRAIPKIPGLKSVSMRGHRGGTPGSDIDIQLRNADSAVLKRAAAEVIEHLNGIDGVSGVDDDLPYGKPELVMKLTPRAANLGFTADLIGQNVRDQLEGRVARKLAVGDDEIEIRVQRKQEQGSGDEIRSLWLKSPSGVFVPLSELVTFTERQSFSLIQRYDGKTTISVEGDLDADILTVSELVKQLDEEFLPQLASRYGIEYKFSGKDKETKEAFKDLKLGVFVALSVIYIVLAWLFASYWRPLAIMLIIPFGFVGAILGHYLLGFKLTILSMIGLLGLAGILVNDSIVLVSRLDERIAGGEDVRKAAIGASRDRLRAVLLTSFTTIGGLTPLLFEASRQAEFLKPMAITMVFGLGVATLFVLFLVPVLFGIGTDIARISGWIVNRRYIGHPHGEGGTPAE